MPTYISLSIDPVLLQTGQTGSRLKPRLPAVLGTGFGNAAVGLGTSGIGQTGLGLVNQEVGSALVLQPRGAVQFGAGQIATTSGWGAKA